MKKYIIQDREAGNQIDEFNTYEEAREQLDKYEDEDRADGVFEEDFYEIVEVENEKTNIAISGKVKSEEEVFEIYREWFLENFVSEDDRDYLRNHFDDPDFMTDGETISEDENGYTVTRYLCFDLCDKNGSHQFVVYLCGKDEINDETGEVNTVIDWIEYDAK